MPGLFDNGSFDQGNGGLFGKLFDAFSNISGAMNPQLGQQMMQQKALQATYQAYQQAGVPEPLARVFALNPDAAKQYGGAYLDTAPKLQDTGTDPLTGQHQFAIYRSGQNPTLTQAPIGNTQGGQAGTSTQQGMETFRKAAESGVTGEGLYQYLPEGAREFVKSIVEGRQQVSPMSLRNPALLPLISAANVIDPTLDMSNPAARQKAMIDAKSGTVAQSQRGINQTIHHITTQLIPAMDATGNTSVPLFNSVKNFANQAAGGTNTTSFYPTALAIADEMSRAFKGNHMSDAQINGWAQSLSPNMSPDQQKKAVGTLLGLLQGAADSAHEQRVQGIGAINDAKLGPMIHEQGQGELASIQHWIKGDAPQQAQPTLPQGWKYNGARSDAGSSFNVAASSMSPMEQKQMQRRINNADDDKAILKIRQDLEKRGIDPDSVPALRMGATG